MKFLWFHAFYSITCQTPAIMMSPVVEYINLNSGDWSWGSSSVICAPFSPPPPQGRPGGLRHGERKGADFSSPLGFPAAVLHDLGKIATFAPGCSFHTASLFRSLLLWGGDLPYSSRGMGKAQAVLGSLGSCAGCDAPGGGMGTAELGAGAIGLGVRGGRRGELPSTGVYGAQLVY